MKTSIIISIIVALSLSILSCSQGKYDCEETLNQKPYSATFHNQWDEDSIKRDYEIFAACGNLDSVDCEIFKGPMLGIILMDEMRQVDNYNAITFQTCLDLIKKYKTKHKTDYDWLYNGTEARMQIEKLPVELSTFESVKPNLIAAGMKNTDVDDFKLFLEKKNKSWTYKEAVKAFFETQQTKTTSAQPIEFPNLENLDKALAEAKAGKKNCLIYFTGWGCVNSRKFEEQLLTSAEVQQQIKNNFVYKAAYVDDKQPHPNGKGSIGDVNSKLQTKKFKSTAQPLLYILSPDGKIIAEWSYEDGVGAFQEFIKKGK